MTGGRSWKGVQDDPTAGVMLWPTIIHCPRCGVEKGTHKTARPGLCRDCSGGLSMEERRAWGEPRTGSGPRKRPARRARP